MSSTFNDAATSKESAARPPTTRPDMWDRWLAVVVAGIMVFGAALVVLPGPMIGFFNWLLFAGADKPINSPEARSYLGFSLGVLGAAMIGWMVALVPLLRGPLRMRQPWAWQLVVTSLLAWYVIDSTMSLVSGFWQNTVFNTGLLLAAAPPLFAMRRKLLSRNLAPDPVGTERSGSALKG